MIRRIATLLGLIGLAGLLCLVAALTSGCGSPLTKGGFDQRMQHNLGPTYGYFDAQRRMAEELQGEVAKLWASLGEVANGQQTLAEWATQTTDRLVQLERAGKITQRDLGLARGAIDNLKKQMADARNASAGEHEGIGRKIGDSTFDLTGEVRNVGTAVADVGRKVDTSAADAKTASVALDQKVDRRADEIVGAVKSVDVKVDVTKTAAETAGAKAETAGAKAESAGSRAEAAAAKAGADTVVEVGKARKELADHTTEAAKNRAGIIAELNRLITRPLP